MHLQRRRRRRRRQRLQPEKHRATQSIDKVCRVLDIYRIIPDSIPSGFLILMQFLMRLSVVSNAVQTWQMYDLSKMYIGVAISKHKNALAHIDDRYNIVGSWCMCVWLAWPETPKQHSKFI